MNGPVLAKGWGGRGPCRGHAYSAGYEHKSYFTEYFVNAPPAYGSEFGPSAA